MNLCGEAVRLMPERCLYWERRRTLVLADPHLGKADAFRAAAVPVPGAADAGLDRLGRALDRTGAERLVVLGDFWHARIGRTPRVIGALTDWRRARASLHVELIRGNHDRAGDPPPGWVEGWYDAPRVDLPFVFAHYPEISTDGFVLAGHLHPAVVVAGRGRQRLRLSCFWFGSGVGVLPAFGEFTGAGMVRPAAGDRVYVIAEDEVIVL